MDCKLRVRCNGDTMHELLNCVGNATPIQHLRVCRYRSWLLQRYCQCLALPAAMAYPRASSKHGKRSSDQTVFQPLQFRAYLRPCPHSPKICQLIFGACGPRPSFVSLTTLTNGKRHTLLAFFFFTRSVILALTSREIYTPPHMSNFRVVRMLTLYRSRATCAQFIYRPITSALSIPH